MVLNYTIEVQKKIDDGIFYRLNIEDKAKVWFSDRANIDEFPSILAIHNEITSRELKGFRIYVNIDDSKHYYSSIYEVTPQFAGTPEEIKESLSKFTLVSDICDTIEHFFITEFFKIRSKE